MICELFVCFVFCFFFFTKLGIHELSSIALFTLARTKVLCLSSPTASQFFQWSQILGRFLNYLELAKTTSPLVIMMDRENSPNNSPVLGPKNGLSNQLIYVNCEPLLSVRNKIRSRFLIPPVRHHKLNSEPENR